MIIDELIKKAAVNKKTIVLPELEDIRVLKAAKKASELGFVNIVLVGNSENISKINSTLELSKVEIINIDKSTDILEFSNLLYELRKDKGITIDKAEQLLKDPVYYAVTMLKMGKVDGVVCGAVHSSSDTIRPALQIIKAKRGNKCVSSFFIMETDKKELGADGKFIFSDCGLIENPTSEQLAEIAKSSAITCKEFLNVEPNVALLSYSTKGSAKSDMVDKVTVATEILQEQNVDFNFDGELQLDSAIIEEVANMKAPNSSVAGKANVLVFPDLNSGNIGYKLVQRFGNANAYGPIMQGLDKPVNDLSRGCSVDDIVATIAITALQ